MKNRFTFRRAFDHWRKDELTPTVLAEENVISVVERCDGDKMSTFLVGPAIERLYKYEQLNYTPEELRKIIRERNRPDHYDSTNDHLIICDSMRQAKVMHENLCRYLSRKAYSFQTSTRGRLVIFIAPDNQKVEVVSRNKAYISLIGYHGQVHFWDMVMSFLDDEWRKENIDKKGKKK